jgi:glycosyltransferase involved in cell wall biosynthesis
MRRVLLLNYEFPPLGGGASPVSYEIAKKLVDKGGFDIDVVTMGYKGLPSFAEDGPRLRIHRVPCWRSKKELCHPWEQLTYLATGYRKAAELHEANPYDICHAHFLIPTGIIARRLKMKYGLEYVVTAHGSDVPGFNNDRFKLLHRFTGPVLRKVARQAKSVVSPSNYLKGLMLENIDAGLESRIRVIPNGIDVQKFTPAEKTNIILGTGRLLPRKGFQYLIEAVSERDIGYEVHICGDGPMMGALRELRKKSKTKVVLHGWLDNNSATYRELLQCAAIYVLPSLKENASIALLEAMCAGAAVVTTDISGCPETVGGDGVLVEPASVQDLRSTLYALTADPRRLKTLQQAMRRRVEAVFSWKVVLESYQEALS